MREVILFIANSLDGFIARPDGQVDWLFTDADYGMAAFYSSIDTVLIGRKTYDMMLGFGESSYKGKKNYVFSRTKTSSKDKNVQFVAGNLREFVASLKQAAGKALWLVGGSELIESFMNPRLIDRFILTVHPVILGAGIPLFRAPLSQTDLKLRKCTPFESGIVQLHYDLR